MDEKGQVLSALKRSGFPFQTRVRHEVEAQARDGWKILASEHPWRDPEGRTQFVDLITYCDRLVLLIECKRVQDKTMTFLRPVHPLSAGMVPDFSGCSSMNATISYHANLPLPPRSYVSEFCVSANNQGNPERLLEQDARLLVLACEDFAERGMRPHLHWLAKQELFLIPVIVTTGPLYTTSYHPTQVSLETGIFTNLDLDAIEAVQWVRFHKTLTAEGYDGPRTVFVVNATALGEFLRQMATGS